MPVGTGEWDTATGAGREVRREFSVGFTGDGAVVREGLTWCSVAELGRRLRD